MEKDDKLEDSQKLDELAYDGVYTVPGEDDLDVMKLRDYCKSNNIKANELTDEEIKQFEMTTDDIKKAITNMLDEANLIAKGKKKAASFDDIFGSDD